MKNFIFNKEVLPGKLMAIKEYGKFVTRRTQGLDEINKEPDKWELTDMFTFSGRQQVIRKIPLKGINNLTAPNPRYQVGDKVFIREPFRFVQGNGDSYDYAVVYNDGELKFFCDNAGIMNYPINEKIQSPYSMSEKGARYFGTVTSVRLERLQEITPEDCVLEGIEKYTFARGALVENSEPRWKFVKLWNSISKPPLMWEDNPYTFRYEVEVK